MRRPSLLPRLAALLLALLPPLGAAGGRGEQALLDAIRSGDLAAAQARLQAGANPAAPLAGGASALAWAVEGQDPRMVRLLLDARAPVDGGAVSPLLLACQHGEPEIVAALIDAGADVRRADRDGVTPLALCAGSAPAPLLERLIAAGALVEAIDAQQQTPLMHAAAAGRIDNIRLLAAQGAQINRQTPGGFTPLFFALKSGVAAAPLTVLELGGDADHRAGDGSTAVQLAMYQKDYAFAALMIARRADRSAYDRNGNQLLHAAVLAGQPQLVKLLLAQGADPNAATGAEQVKMRFEANFKGGDYQRPLRTPLLLAAEQGDAEIMRLLVAAGARPGYRAPDGSTVVLAAASGPRLAALRLALQLAPDPDVVNDSGQTALHLLLSGAGHDETGAMMQLLAAHKARLDIRNRRGQTAAEQARDAQAPVRALFYATFPSQTATL